MFRKHRVILSEKVYRRIQRYALSVDASIDQAADYVVNEWMNSTGEQIVRAREVKERLMAGRLKLQVVYRNQPPSAEGRPVAEGREQRN
jgi:hypothetical protein